MSRAQTGARGHGQIPPRPNLLPVEVGVPVRELLVVERPDVEVTAAHAALPPEPVRVLQFGAPKVRLEQW